jgi:dUTP pyrophosphatase
MYDLEKMKVRVLEIMDPNNSYTQEDFNKEFNGTSVNSFEYDPEHYKLKLPFSNKSNNPDPEYATNGSSGFDIRAYVNDPIIIRIGESKLIPTGLYFEIPSNFEIQIRSRSGTAVKSGVVVLNSPGTIDADYRGEIKVILVNHGAFDFTVNNGDRIAQAVVASVIAKNVLKLHRIDDVSIDTERGAGGFGSTGTK